MPATRKFKTSSRIRVSKKPVGYIKRPPNAFILFQVAFGKERKRDNSSDTDTRACTPSKRAATAWYGLPAFETAYWYALAAEVKREHKLRYPNYVFRPARKTMDERKANFNKNKISCSKNLDDESYKQTGRARPTGTRRPSSPPPTPVPKSTHANIYTREVEADHSAGLAHNTSQYNFSLTTSANSFDTTSQPSLSATAPVYTPLEPTQPSYAEFKPDYEPNGTYATNFDQWTPAASNIIQTSWNQFESSQDIMGTPNFVNIDWASISTNSSTYTPSSGSSSGQSAQGSGEY